MLRLKSMICWLVLLSLAVPLGNAWAKQPKFDVNAVSEISLDVLRVEACARKKGCVVASGPTQLNLLDLADGNIDFANQVLLPERTKELRLVLGENNTITVNNEPFPLAVPSGQRSGLKLKGRKAFGKEGGFLSDLTLKLNLQKQLVVKRGKSGSKGSGKGNRQGKSSVAYSYKLKPVIKVATAEITPLTDEIAAVVAMPDEDNEITIGEKFSLFIPAGAVSAPMVISVKETKYTVEVMDEETGEVVEKPALSSKYELSPDGAEFGEPLVATVPYNPDTLPSYISEYDIAVYLDDEKIPTDINTMSKTAVADVWHFSTLEDKLPRDNGWYCGSTDPDDPDLDDNTLYYWEKDSWIKNPEDEKHPKLCDDGCVTMATGTDDMCSAGPSAFVFPFERDHVWQICQGYNNSNITHNSTFAWPTDLSYSFDFAYGSNNACNGSNKGCCGTSNDSKKDASGSEDKTVIAPAAGKIAWIDKETTELTCLNLENAAPNGEVGVHIVSVMLGHMKSGVENDRIDSGSVSQGETLGILRGIDESLFPYAHVHMSAYTATNCGGMSVPLGTVFKEGDYNFSRDKSWYDTEILSTCPSGNNGLYCGSAVSRDVNTLYSCTNGVYSDEKQCDNGCENSSCISAPASCPSGNGLYCGTVNPLLNNDTLYDCQDGDYEVYEQCTNGCEGNSCMVPESCPGSTSLYCGQSSLGQNMSYLYYCQNGNYDVQDVCANGCEPMPGEEDRCLAGVYSVAPSDAILGESTIFTVSGDSLPSTLEFDLEGCTSVQSLGGTSTTQRFSCIPGITGQKDGVIRKVDGTELKTFTVDVLKGSGTSPVVDSVTTTGAEVGKLSNFTVNGKDLPFTVIDEEEPSCLRFILNDCTGVSRSLGGSSTAMDFSCTPHTNGPQNGIIEQTDGTPLKTFTIDVL